MAASTISFNNGEIGTNATITISKDNSAYTNTITYYFEGASGTIVTKTAATSVSWAIPSNLAERIPNSLYGTCVLTCTTFDGNIQIGSTTLSTVLYINQDNYKPTVSYTITDLNTGAAALCGANRYILRQSKLKINITATGAGGATIRKKEVYVYNNNESKFSVDYNSGFLLAKDNFDVVVTDSRGLTTTVTHSFSTSDFLRYIAPTISTFYVSSYSGGYANVHIGGTFSQNSSYSTSNTITVKLSYGDANGQRTKYTAPVTYTSHTSEYQYYTVDYSLPISNYGADKWVWVDFNDRVCAKYDCTEMPRQGLPVFDFDNDDINFNVHANFATTTTFANNAQFNNNISVGNQIYIKHQTPRLEFDTLDSGGTQTGAVSIYGYDSSDILSIYDWNNNANLLRFLKNGRTRLYNITGASVGLDSDSTYTGFRPIGDDTLSLGSGGNRWAQIYSSHSTISTSDRNQKKEIEPLAATEEKLFDKLKPVKYKFNNGDRIHHGLIAQDVETAMDDLKLCALDFGGLCYDYVNDTKVYSLRYEEFIPMCIHKIQVLEERIKELEKKLGEGEN